MGVLQCYAELGDNLTLLSPTSVTAFEVATALVPV